MVLLTLFLNYSICFLIRCEYPVCTELIWFWVSVLGCREWSKNNFQWTCEIHARWGDFQMDQKGSHRSQGVKSMAWVRSGFHSWMTLSKNGFEGMWRNSLTQELFGSSHFLCPHLLATVFSSISAAPLGLGDCNWMDPEVTIPSKVSLKSCHMVWLFTGSSV